MTKRPTPVDFDEYASDYEDLLRKQLFFFDGDRDYFSEYKVAITAELVEGDPATILDFGGGIGLSIPPLRRHFPNARIFLTDTSEKSLAIARDRFADVTVLSDNEAGQYRFDLIFVAGVFHHVPVERRAALCRRLASLLNAGGRVVIFEHNPFNPVTRYLVSTCAFDKDAVLVSMRQMKHLVAQAGLRIVYRGYCLFLPRPASRLRRFEGRLRWLPVGGQHFVVAGK